MPVRERTPEPEPEGTKRPLAQMGPGRDESRPDPDDDQEENDPWHPVEWNRKDPKREVAGDNEPERPSGSMTVYFG